MTDLQKKLLKLQRKDVSIIDWSWLLLFSHKSSFWLQKMSSDSTPFYTSRNWERHDCEKSTFLCMQKTKFWSIWKCHADNYHFSIRTYLRCIVTPMKPQQFFFMSKPVRDSSSNNFFLCERTTKFGYTRYAKTQGMHRAHCSSLTQCVPKPSWFDKKSIVLLSIWSKFGITFRLFWRAQEWEWERALVWFCC
jgi:hypothetical protein